MIPFLNCDVAWIVLMIQLSEVPNSPSGPVSGWMKPITMGWVLPPAVDEDEDEEEDEEGALDAGAAGLKQSAAPHDRRAGAGRAQHAASGYPGGHDSPQTPAAHGRTVRPPVAA